LTRCCSVVLQPWYTTAPVTGDKPSASGRQAVAVGAVQDAPGLLSRKADESDSGCSDRDRRKSHKSKKHKHKKSHKSSKHKDKDKYDLSAVSKVKKKKGKSVEELRRERLQREQAERVRARSVVAGAVDISERCVLRPGVARSCSTLRALTCSVPLQP
jgi:citrate lyase gamma subunit